MDRDLWVFVRGKRREKVHDARLMFVQNDSAFILFIKDGLNFYLN